MTQPSYDRLARVAPDLSELVKGSTRQGRRRLAMAASRFAVERSGLSDPIIDAALNELAAGNVQAGTRRAVEELVRSLDDDYFDLKETGEQGDAPIDAYRSAFEKARAANAVFYALLQDSPQAAAEAVYEAKAATSDTDSLRTIAIQALKEA